LTRRKRGRLCEAASADAAASATEAADVGEAVDIADGRCSP